MSKHTSLASFVPTAEEVAAARTLLRAADAKTKKSKQNSFTQFLNGNKGGKGNEELLALKAGDEKNEAIIKYMVYQQAKQNGRLTNTRSNIEGKMGYKDFVPMNDWKMRQEVGDRTADEWQALAVNI